MKKVAVLLCDEPVDHIKKEFGDYPEDYYNKLYPDQMAANWREEFKKL